MSLDQYKLCIYTEDDNVYMKVQCYDIDSKYPVCETHVRMYVLDKDLKLHPIRVLYPYDDLGAMLFTSLPVQIIHQIDHHSPLSPRGMPLVIESNGLPLKSADSRTNNRLDIICPVCGESYGTYELLRKHVEFNQMAEEQANYPPDRCHLGFVMPEIIPLTISEIQIHMEMTLAEIIVLVEGIDPQASGTFQSLQSYKYEDIVWEGDFEPCLSVRNDKFVVDLKKFHQVRVREEALEKDGSDVERQEPCEEEKKLE